MGGGGGGYNRPPGDSGSSDDEVDEPGVVPEPDHEEEESEDESRDKPSGGTPPSAGSGGGGGGAPPGAGPGGPIERPGGDEQTDDSDEDGSDPSDSEPPDDGHEEKDPEHPEGSDDGESQTDEDTEDDPSDPAQGDDGEDSPADHEDDEDQEGQEEEQGDEDDEPDEEDEDECLIAELAILHSPNPEALEDAAEDQIHSVELRDGAVCVIDDQDRTVGAIAEPWVDTIKNCIENGREYRARILELDGGKCQVRITNKCLLNQNLELVVDSDALEQLHPGSVHPIVRSDQAVSVVTTNDTRITEIPEPWGQLLHDCIDSGRVYHLEVLEVSSDHCEVTLKNGAIDE